MAVEQDKNEMRDIFSYQLYRKRETRKLSRILSGYFWAVSGLCDSCAGSSVYCCH